MKNAIEELKREIKKLHAKFDSDEIFDALVSVTSGSDENYLTDATISYLNIYKGMNVVKFNGLNQQIEFEEKINSILPYQNDKTGNLFTSNL